ncbi:hypothetical protein Fmac_004938 [Flemingia macrophylla]|uniref:Uncharacterized protein n=1 Tax=Flemingia macrophylla TaxID=520843 RepID=A0ABD1N7Q1_9FABA
MSSEKISIQKVVTPTTRPPLRMLTPNLQPPGLSCPLYNRSLQEGNDFISHIFSVMLQVEAHMLDQNRELV